MIRAVAFDLDYTLAVPERPRAELLDRAAARVGAPRVDREAYLEAHDAVHPRETRAPIFAELFETEAVDPEQMATADPEAMATAYREEIAAAITPISGVPELVERLRERYRVGLLTDGPVRAQADKLETLGWSGLFDAVVITGELDAGKPDPAAFETLCERLEVEPTATVYVGDHPVMDVAGARAAGLRAIQVTYPGGPAPDSRADAHVERDELATELAAVIDRIFAD